MGFRIKGNNRLFEATDSFEDVPKAGWRDLVIERRYHIKTRMTYNSRMVFKFIEDAEVMYQELGFSSVKHFLYEGLEMADADFRLAHKWLSGRFPDEGEAAMKLMLRHGIVGTPE
jgi:hypothetical protein